MRFKYVGLTQKAAICCAADMRSRFSRMIVPQVWAGSGATYPSTPYGFGWYWPAAVGRLDQTYERKDVAEVAEPRQVSGGLWEVEVDVYEDLTYNHTAFSEVINEDGTGADNHRFVAFEIDPDGDFGEFIGGGGGVAGADGWYPTARDKDGSIRLYPVLGWSNYLLSNRAIKVRARLELEGIRGDGLSVQFWVGDYPTRGQWLQAQPLSNGWAQWRVTDSDNVPTAMRLVYVGDKAGLIESNVVRIGEE
jgi:hypothetical protein